MNLQQSHSPALPGDDRRVSKRAPVDLFMNRFLGGQPYLCVARDVSHTGMRLRTLLGPQLPNHFVGLQFQLPGSNEVLTASGEVVREGSEEVSIRFTHMPAASRQALEQFLAAN
ncbi:MAG: PilZ domain-containing protein [Deltaproteobacteria bacterium]|nr:PilZ domain-containing protein [Deltaproteobacteria bacterium]